MVIVETEEVVRQQRVNEHKNILDMIDMLNKRLVKIEDVLYKEEDNNGKN